MAVWNSGILLTRLLDALSQKEIDAFRGKTVLELGCGTAAASIAASKLGAKYVIATDGNVEVLELARRNFDRNGIFNGEVAALQWSLLDASDFIESADFIIGSDLTYNSGTWGALAETVSLVLKHNGLFIYLTLGHSGFNSSGELEGFLTVVESASVLSVVKENSVDWPFSNIPSLNDLLNDALTGSEKLVVDGNGGVRIVVLKKKKSQNNQKIR